MQDRAFLDEFFSFTTVEGHTSFTGGASILLQSHLQIEHQFKLSEVLSAKHAAARFFEDSKPGATPQHSGFELVCQLTRNKLTHSLNGNTTGPMYIQLDKLLPTTEVVLHPKPPHTQAESQSSTLTSQPSALTFRLQSPHFVARPNTQALLSTTPSTLYTRQELLSFRKVTQPTTTPFGFPKLSPSKSFAASAHGLRSRTACKRHAQTTPPFTGTACAALPLNSKRTGRRVKLFYPRGIVKFYSRPKRKRSTQNSRIRLSQPDNPRTPPPRGMPGISSEIRKECPPKASGYNASCRGPLRAEARRAFRSWRAGCKQTVEGGADSLFPTRGQSTKATPRRAKWFRETIWKQETAPRNRKPKVTKNKITPPLAYKSKLRIGSLNVQGLAETLKLKTIIQVMSEHNLDVVMLSETRSTSYYSYSSEGHLVILSGNHRDKFAGVGAVIHPRLRPHLSDVLQLTNRILHLTFNQKGGRVHIIGAYGPHSGHDFETVREPFWNQLEEHIDKIPQPEPVYLTGDFNVRFQAQHAKDDGVTGPFTYGKGRRHIDHSALSNRTLCVNAMRMLDMVEVASYKTPAPVHHITYRDKAAPPQDWSQYVLDPLIMQQFYDKLSNMDSVEALPIAARIRSFLDLPHPLPPPCTEPHPNPVLFQRLDHTFTRKQWLSSINSCRSKLYTGFPTDHYLLVTEVQVKLAKRTKSAPPPPRFDFTKLSLTQKDLYNETLANLLDVVTEVTEPLDHTASINIYTDGSGSRGVCSASTAAGWGWASKQGETWIEACGPVITSPNHFSYLGATVGSNNTGEITAIIEALLFASEHEYTHVHIHSDSQWAIKVITGKWRAKANKALVQTAQKLYRKSGMVINFTWVKGHQGNEGNERADKLAEVGKNSYEVQGGRTLPYVTISDPRPSRTDHTADTFVTAMQEAAKDTLSYRQFVPRTPWITDATLLALEEARRAEAAQAADWKELRNKAKRLAKKDRVGWVHRELTKDLTGTSSTVWNVVRRQKRGFQGRRAHLEEDGRPQPWSRTHEVFRNHLQNSQWATPVISQAAADKSTTRPHLHPTQADEGPFTLQELKDALAKIKAGKAPGPDGVVGELFQNLDPQSEEILLDIYNKIWIEGDVPRSWVEARVVTIFKNKGSDSDPSSYRPISLLNSVYKIYSAMLQTRLATCFDSRLRSTQYGFRSKRSTTQPLFILRRAMEWSTMTNTPLHLLFLDWKQAFDSLDHTAMLHALERFGLSSRMLCSITSIYRNPLFCVRGFNNAECEGTVHAGIRQGCPLSPYLFIIVLSVMLHDLDADLSLNGTPQNVWSVSHSIYDLEYADDTLLLSITSSQLQQFLSGLEAIAAEYGMKLNQGKTEILTHPKLSTPTIHFLDGSQVKTTPQIKYLGSLVSWEKPFEVAFYHRLGLAEEAYKKLRLVWNSNKTRSSKVRVFQTVFLPTLLYGLETLTLTPKQLHRIDGQYYRFLRRAIGIKASYYSRISNKTVWEQAGCPELPSERLSYQQYSLTVQVYRSHRQDPMHSVIFGPCFKDRIVDQGRRRGMQFPYWLEVYSRKYFPHHLPSRGILGPHQHYANIAREVRNPQFELAPKRAFVQRARP